MTPTRLILRSLRRYWKSHVATACGFALATAVITGSLLVGHSLAESIRRMALRRLGRIDHALSAPHGLRDSLADELRASVSAEHDAAMVLVARGAARNLQTEATVPNIQIVGIDADFPTLFDGDVWTPHPEPTCAVNRPLADAMGLSPGDFIRISVPRRNEAPGNTLFARRARHEHAAGIRLKVDAILPDDGFGGFTLSRQTEPPRNLFLDRTRLARAMAQEGKANLLLVNNGSIAWQAAIDSLLTLEDYGLEWKPHDDNRTVSIASSRLTLEPRQVDAIQQAADRIGAEPAITSVYLADHVQSAHGDAAYVVLAGISDLSRLELLDEATTERDAEETILINTWLAEDLKASPGDPISLTYRIPTTDGDFADLQATFRIKGIVAMTGLAADPALTPPFPGITDAETVGDWDPPFPIDLTRVRPRDEDYWQRHRATPKAFVSPDALRHMWQQGHPATRTTNGDSPWITSVRLHFPESMDAMNAHAQFMTHLRRFIPPEQAGMRVRPVRKLALESAPASQEFSMMFLAMSIFILLAALWLSAMLMRLLVRQRSREYGMLLTCGFVPQQASRLIRAEGSLIALLSVLPGGVAGMGYAAGILARMSRGLPGQTGTMNLSLHVSGGVIAAGVAVGLICALSAAHFAARELRRIPIPALLSGTVVLPAHQKRPCSRAGLATAIIAFAGAMLLIFLTDAPVAFFGAGFLLMVSGLLFCRHRLVRRLRRGTTSGRVRMSDTDLALNHAACHPGRSLVIIALPGVAALILSTVSALIRDPAHAGSDRLQAATGGFDLRAVTAIPPPVSFDSPTGRKRLGFTDEEERLFENVRVLSLIATDGDDISCVNLAVTDTPRFLSIPPDFFEQTGWASQIQIPPEDPWDPGAPSGDTMPIPVFGDAETLQWQLHRGPGELLDVFDPGGIPLRLHISGRIPTGIFAGELLMPAPHFQRQFPHLRTPRYFLLDAPPERIPLIRRVLHARLDDFGVETTPTHAILREIAAVQNTYIHAFMALGGLGAVLGTFGLVVFLLRDGLERRKEFALLATVGFRRTRAAGILLREHLVLMVSGLALGMLASVPPVASQWVINGTPVHWRMLGLTMGGMFLTGSIAGILAAGYAVRGQLLPLLRSD